MERADWTDRALKLKKEAEAETERANEIATIYGLSLSKSQDLAYQLRRKTNEQRDKLASCDVRGAVHLNPGFVRLYNDALQTGPTDPNQLVSEAGGASASDVAEVHIENGRRWKDCRLQLNAIIDVMEPMT